MSAAKDPAFTEAALFWARRDVPVFPCKQRDKSPFTRNGFKDATTDETQIRAWGKRHKSALVGIDLERAGWVVLDTDPRHEGDKSFSEQGRLLPPTWCSTTRGGGTHHFFQNPNGVGNRKPLPGLDIKGAGGYVIVPPSPGYRWHIGPGQFGLAEPAVWPTWLDQLGTNRDSGEDGQSDPFDVEAVLEGASRGERDDSAYRYALSMRARNFRKSEALIFMERAWAAMEQPLGDEYPLDTALEKVHRAWREVKAGTSRGMTGNFELDVQRELYRRSVYEEVEKRQQAARVKYERLDFPDPDHSLADELKEAPGELPYRVEGLQPVGSNIVLVAGYKLGKTTLQMNLIRSLADGTPFLGRFPVQQVEGNIGVIQYELNKYQWIEWARRMGIQNVQRIKPWHMRGSGALRFWVPSVQDRLVEWMLKCQIKYWVIDPTARAWEGLLESEGDNIKAGQFLAAIDDVKARAGISEAHLSHHTGRDPAAQKRGRGATRLEDWADASWYLHGKRDDLTFHAIGRDVDLEETPIVYSEENKRSFTLSEHTKVGQGLEEGAFRILEAVAELEAGDKTSTRSAVKEQMRGDTSKLGEWLQEAQRRLWVTVTKQGQGRPTLVATQPTGKRELEKRASR